MEKIKSEMKIVFGKEKPQESAKVFVDSNVSVFQKGDHVLVVGVKRKLPTLLGDKVPNDESDDGEYVEVNFFNRTKDRGWRILEVVHVVKMSEIESLSRTRCYLEFEDLLNLSVCSDTSFDI